MEKISKEQFFALFNEKIQDHPAYKKGYKVCYDNLGYCCIDELGNRVTGNIALADTYNKLRKKYQII